MMKKILLSLAAVALVLGLAGNAQAQACTVTVSIATTGTTSSSCFVRSGGQAYVNLTGTWVGTVHVQDSSNNGASWSKIEETTATGAYTLVPKSRNRLVRVIFHARTSGTLTGSITYNVNTTTRRKYSSIPIGSVAYSSLGTSVSVIASTSLMIADLIVTEPFRITGIGALIGATTGTNAVILSLYNSAGGLVANTAVAGTTTGAANAFQEIAITSGPIDIPAGRYFCGLQMDGTTDKYRAVATSTFVDVIGDTVTGAAFGTMLPAITVPTTFTADKGPICYVY